jgi:hypothetical protein
LVCLVRDQIRFWCPRAGEDLDRLHIRTVAGDRPVVVPVGAHQVREQLGVTGVGLRTGDVVAVAVARDRERVDRVDLIAGGGQRLHP